jgi:hypothetical protein
VALLVPVGAMSLMGWFSLGWSSRNAQGGRGFVACKASVA